MIPQRHILCLQLPPGTLAEARPQAGPPAGRRDSVRLKPEVQTGTGTASTFHAALMHGNICPSGDDAFHTGYNLLTRPVENPYTRIEKVILLSVTVNGHGTTIPCGMGCIDIKELARPKRVEEIGDRTVALAAPNDVGHVAVDPLKKVHITLMQCHLWGEELPQIQAERPP